MKIIAIAGGSGAGKSTVAYKLQDEYPNKFEVLNFDDYQKVKSDDNLPKLYGMTNWDHPDIIKWNDLLRDIDQLKKGNSITIQSWAHRSNPDYHVHKQMMKRTITPKDYLIVEGYLALFNNNLNKFYDLSIFLDIDENTRNKRRDKGAVVSVKNYVEKILIPMHKKYVEPTMEKADFVINTSSLTSEEVADKIKTKLNLN